ncbi:MAG: hypothetical protein QXX45_03800 [Candidatus Aenigmatarchaeota archaeon]
MKLLSKIITQLIFLFLLVLFVFLINFTPSFSQTSYKAKIANYSITIELKKEDNNKIIGRYKYDKVRKWLKLEGKIPSSSNRVIINEYDENDKNTGYFIGILSKDKTSIKLLNWIDKKKNRKLKVYSPWIRLSEEKEKQQQQITTKIRKYKLGDYDDIWLIGLYISDKFYNISAVYKKDNKHYIQINDKIYGPYERAWNLLFSPDSSKYGFCYKKGNKEYIQINDKTYGPFDKADFTFTKDNRIFIGYVKGKELAIEEIK